MQIIRLENGFTLSVNGREVVTHTSEKPFIFVGLGDPDIQMCRGNFKIEDYLIEREALRNFEIEENKIYLSDAGNTRKLELIIKETEGRSYIEFKTLDETINRTFIRLNADKEEKIYGCGEQLSYFNLRGNNFPLWSSEPGVGRNKSTHITWQADQWGMNAGGDYFNTNYPEPTFVSTNKYYCHVDTTAYSDFNFKNEEFHELEIWEVPATIMFETGETYLELVENLTAFFGRQPELPEWVYNGIMLGIQGGTELTIEKMEKALEKGVKVSGAWCQDWQGIRYTSFGKRLDWNWKWNPDVYPELDTKIHELKEKGLRFMGYINPYVVNSGDQFAEAEEKGYLALNKEGETYLVDFGEFYCGVVDFTLPAACEWYKNIIKVNMIDFGLDGWMADFGEYLPTDCVLANGVSAEIMHNAWPAMWAKINYEAVKESGKLGEVVYFMRAGFTGNQKYCTLLWGGDQCVDWTLDDGLASVIPAALSAGMTGNGLHHSDTGGYTTLFELARTRELFQRWAEMNAFTPFMRSHEGNRPDTNHQFDTDDETLEHLARMTQVYTELAPYTKALVKENADKGIPCQRPIFMHYEDDQKAYDIKYQYMYGSDLVVAPIYTEAATEGEVHLPNDTWVHLWTGKEYTGGDYTVEAPLGNPPVFYRKDSEYRELFEKIGKM
jgi:alpha-glucosidase